MEEVLRIIKLAMALSGMYVHICIMYTCGVSRILEKWEQDGNGKREI